MTGQAQTQGFNQAQFKTAVCTRIYGLFNCQAASTIDVQTLHLLRRQSTPRAGRRQRQPADHHFGYTPGGPGDIVVVRLMYQWPVYVSLLGLNLSNMSGNKRLLMATAAFRNEPYQ